MPGTAKYRHVHTDALGRTVEIFLDKEDYSGSVLPMKLGPGVFVRTDSDADSDEMTPQRPWVAEIPIPATAIAVMDDVFSDTKRWWVRRVVDGELDRIGIVSKDERERGADLIPEDSHLVAYDGIGWLQHERFVGDDGTVRSLLDLGPQPWIYWVLFCLNKLGFELDVATAANWYTPDMDGGVTPLLQEYVPPGCYVSVNAEPPSCLYVLKDLLKGYNAFISQEGGTWHIYQRELMAQESFTRTIFPFDYYDGNPVTTTDSYSPRFDVSNVAMMQKGPSSPLRKAYAGAQVNHVHGAVESIIENPSFSLRYGDEGADQWTLSGAATTKFKDVSRQSGGGIGQNLALFLPAIHSLLGLTVDLKLDGGSDHATTTNPRQVQAGTQLMVAPRIYLELTAAGRAKAKESALYQANLLITLDDGEGTIRYLHADPATESVSWSVSKKRCSMYVAPEEWQTPSVRTPATPYKGRLSVRLESVVEFGPLGFAYETFGIYYDDIRVFPAPENEDVSTSRTEVIDFVDRSSGLLRDPIEVIHGTGPSSAHEAATRDAAGALLTDWKVGPYTVEPDSGTTKAQLLAHQVLVQTRNGNLVLKAGFLKQVPVSCIRTLVIDSKLYLPVYVREDDETNEKKALLVEVRLDAFPPDYDTIHDDGAQFLVPNTGRGVQHLIRGFSDAAADLAIRAALTVTRDDIGPGVITQLPVEVSQALTSHQVDLEDGKKIMVAGLRGGSWQMTLAADHLPGGNVLTIEPFDLGTDFIPKGSGVHASEQEKANTSTLTRDATYNIIQQNSLALLNGSLSAASVGQLTVSAIREQVRAGQFMTLFRKDGSVAAEFWITKNAPKGAKKLHISATKPVFENVVTAGGLIVGSVHTNQVNVTITAEDGSAVRRSDVYEQLESNATSSGFTRTVTRAEFDALAKRLEEISTGPTQQLTDALGDPILVGGQPILFAKKLREIVPEHEQGIAANGSAIIQLDDQITLIVAGVDPNTVNLATLNVRVGDNEAEISTNTAILANNGLSVGTNITSRVSVTEGDISTNASAISSIGTTLSVNGLTGATNITGRVDLAEDDISSNATAILALETTLTNNGINVATNLTNRVAIAEGDIGTNASAISSIDTTLSANGLTALTNITSRVSTAEGDISTNGSAIVDIGTTLSANGITFSTNITSRVDTLGARVVVVAGGGGVLSTLSLESGSSGSIAAIAASQINLTGDVSVAGSFVLAGANVHITAATTFDSDVTINGVLSSVTGTFSGNLSAAGGTFAGDLSAAGGTFAGALSAATGTFAGTLSAAGGTFTGSLSAATGSFAGSLSAATGSFAGSLSATSGSLGSVTIAVGGGISSTGGTYNWSLAYGSGLSVTTSSGLATAVNAAFISVSNTSVGSTSVSMVAGSTSAGLTIDGDGNGYLIIDGTAVMKADGVTASFNVSEVQNPGGGDDTQFRTRTLAFTSGKLTSAGSWGSWTPIEIIP